MSRRNVTLFGFGALLLNCWALSAHAQTCDDNADCGKGFSCVVVAGGTCAVATPCGPGEKCPEPAPCEPTVFRECQPAECGADTDCADGMVCYQSEAPACDTAIAVAPCPPNETCKPVTPVCPEAQRTCTPRYALPCTQDAECGDGFSCAEQEECSCAGSAGGAPVPNADPGAGPQQPAADAGQARSGGSDSSPGASPSPPADAAPRPAQDGGAAGGGSKPFAPPPPDAVDAGAPRPPTCECHPSAVKRCEAKELACKADADCPALFQCNATGASGGGSCAVSRDGGPPVCETFVLPPPESKHCEPRYARDVGGFGGSKSGDANEAPVAAGIPQPAVGSAPGPTAAHGGVTSGTPPATPTDAEAAPAAANNGCSVGAVGASGSDLGWLVVAAATCIGLRARRRRG
jgi:hypothetical protein